MVVGAGFAQSEVPSTYLDLYTSLQGKISSFDNTVRSQWNGQKAPVVFAAELLSANGNRGLQLLNAQTRTSYLLELSALKGLGVQAVIIPIGFPILYQPFYQFNGDPGDYARMLDFYKQLVADVHGEGLKLIVETSVMFPGFFSSGSGFNLAGYYPTLTLNGLITGRSENAATIAKEVGPDFLNLGSEPDTQAELTGQLLLKTPSGYAELVGSMVDAIRATGATELPLGAGVGTWQSNGVQFIQSLAALDLDYIDLHIFPVNFDFFTNAILFADTAHSLGKKVAISESWLLKERDTEFSNNLVAGDPTIFSRDAYSFWAPLDQAFLSAMVAFSNWKQLQYYSGYWSLYYWSYLDFNAVQNMTPEQTLTQANLAAGTALVNDQGTATGLVYEDLVARTAPPPPSGQAATVSAASFIGTNLAPDSIVAIYGTGLATTTVSATTIPLPASIHGTSVKISDSSGAEHYASLFFVSAGQVNAWLPAGVSSGPATVTVASGAGTVLQGSITVAPVAPGLFAINADGRGPAAAIAVTVRADNSQTYDNVFQCGSTPGSCVNKPINLGSATDKVYLELFGTGVRGRNSLSDVTVTVGGVPVQVDYADTQGTLVGLDQVNVLLPRTLAGRGQVDINLSVAGVSANTVTVSIQ